MLQVSTRRLIEAAEESIKHGTEESFEDDSSPTATKDGYGAITRPLPHLTATTGGNGFYGSNTWEVFFEDLQDPYTAVDTVAMPELQISFVI